MYREPSLSMHRVFKVVIQRCCDSSLGHLVLTVQAFGVDAQEHFDAMASPLSDLSGWDSPIEPGGEARVPQVVWAPGKRGSVLVCRQYASAGLIPGTPIGDGRQWTTLHAPEQEVSGLAVEEGKVLAEQTGEWWRTRYLPTFAFSTMLETAIVRCVAHQGRYTSRGSGEDQR